uniref:Glucosylceramidase putative n=1 Tax=Albugo laibachii Nc14 TaxID=890382 RepID=F0VZS0_9STRA|nr:glucosylceramidase putative [Albugo laibachii Nc14]|eukprot:CCA14291.1 glucosylceramidase putative [Albugo laibachii Nc14]
MTRATSAAHVRRTPYSTDMLPCKDLDYRTHQHKHIRHAILAGLVVCTAFASLLDMLQTEREPSVDPSTSWRSLSVSDVSGSDEILTYQTSFHYNTLEPMQSMPTIQWTQMDTSEAEQSSRIVVDPEVQYQEILGFGGAFTEAASVLYANLPQEKKDEILKLLFGEDGLHFHLNRVPIGSCDFSISSYSFNNVSGDVEMKYFDTGVVRDTTSIIPFIKDALSMNPSLQLFASPWSPPPWMKLSQGSYIADFNGSAIPNGLNPDYRSAWANYLVAYIRAYANKGIKFWGMTLQNEPLFAAPWEACAYVAETQADFLVNYLGPLMRDNFPDLNLMIYDHNLDYLYDWVVRVFRFPGAKAFVNAIAAHWYTSDTKLDGAMYLDRLNDTYHAADGRMLLFSESCNCPGVAQGSEAWYRAHRYAHSIHTVLYYNWQGWVDWNLMLNEMGGPNHAGNFCDAPIIVLEDENDYQIQPLYYALKHYSQFLPPKSIRIKAIVQPQYKKPGLAQLIPGYSVVLNNCDESSRQFVERTTENKLHIAGTDKCIEALDRNEQGFQVELVTCKETKNPWTFDGDRIKANNQCLSLNHGSIENDVRLVMLHCETDASYQRWYFTNGNMRSFASVPEQVQCVTAGWAFLRATAFQRPDKKIVLVIINANTEEATVALQYQGKTAQLRVPASAFQTLVWN